jgi:NDP-sugar pyrophosphorylase family protein
MPPSVNHALLLTAGLGTRLRPLTLVRAKPALPVAGEALARRIIRWLASDGISDVVLNLHHLPHTITSLIGDGRDLGVCARYSWEQPEVLGSAGGPRQALDIIGADRFVIANGDTLTDLDLDPLIDAHMTSGALVSLAVVPNTAPDRYGGLRADDRGCVTGVEPRGSTTPSYHFVGVQVAEREAFANLPRGEVLNSVGGTYAALSRARPDAVRVVQCAARFWDIGTVEDYWHTDRAFADADSSAKVHDEDAGIRNCIVWDHVEVGAGARVERCIVTDGVRIPPGAGYRDAILMRSIDGGIISAPLDA